MFLKFEQMKRRGKRKKCYQNFAKTSPKLSLGTAAPAFFFGAAAVADGRRRFRALGASASASPLPRCGVAGAGGQSCVRLPLGKKAYNLMNEPNFHMSPFKIELEAPGVLLRFGVDTAENGSFNLRYLPAPTSPGSLVP